MYSVVTAHTKEQLEAGLSKMLEQGRIKRVISIKENTNKLRSYDMFWIAEVE